MDISSLQKALLNPGIYPDLPKKIQLIETHISLLFLTGSYVYKVKKPVDFGFLDFTTLE
jgi:aminoglycoside phosphotransferase family enzyme